MKKAITLILLGLLCLSALSIIGLQTKSELSGAGSSYALLFDERRAGADRITQEYSEIAQLLREQGHIVNSTTDTLTQFLLSDFEVLVITCPQGPYDPSELEAIKYFVRGGGGLLLMGQGSISDSAGLNQVAELFGISFIGTGPVRDPDLGTADFEPVITQFASGHPVCKDLGRIKIYAGRVLSIGKNNPLAWGDANTYGDLNNNGKYDLGEPIGRDAVVMADSHLGNGKAVFISDTDLFDNDFLQDHSNQRLFFNIVDWITTSESALDVAEKAATWLISKAENGNPGYKWYEYSNGVQDYCFVMDWGAAGIGTFFLELYEKTGNSTYLKYAEGAGEWIVQNAVNGNPGYMWPTYDRTGTYYTTAHGNGASGVGDFLLNLYRATSNSTFLAYAEGAADWMTSLEEPDGYIPYNVLGTESFEREAMTAMFILDIGKQTGNQTYMRVAKDSAQWIIKNAVSANGGYKWSYQGKYFIYDAYVPAAFLLEMYQTTGNQSYLQYAKGALQWTLSQAVVEGDKAKWPYYEGNTTYQRFYPGGAYLGREFIADVLLDGYAITGNSTYLDYATKQAYEIVSTGIPENGGVKFSMWVGQSECAAYMNAFVYRFLRTMNQVTGNETYVEVANDALTWIIKNATQENNGYKWPLYGQYEMGLLGASGVGYPIISALPLYVFDVTLGKGAIQSPPSPYSIAISCYQSISSFNLNMTEHRTTFSMQGVQPGVCNITIPRCRLDGPFTVSIDGSLTIYTQQQDEYNSFISFMYASGVHSVEVWGTQRGYIIGDVNGDGIVNIVDITLASINFGKKDSDYP